jgi:serine/threonine protein kinase
MIKMGNSRKRRNNTNTNNNCSWNGEIEMGTFASVHQVNINGIPQALKMIYVEPDIEGIGSLSELDVLERFRHPFIVTLNDVLSKRPNNMPKTKDYSFKNAREDQQMFVLELGDIDLEMLFHPDYVTSAILHHSNYNNENIKEFMVHILLALEYMHKYNQYYCDMKPNNILLMKDTNICKLIDFGLSKTIITGTDNTTNICPSPYRAPELFTNNTKFNETIDIWSFALTWIYCLIRNELVITEKITGDDCINLSYQEIMLNMLKTIPHDLTYDQMVNLLTKTAKNPHQYSKKKRNALNELRLQQVKEIEFSTFVPNTWLSVFTNTEFPNNEAAYDTELHRVLALMLDFNHNTRATATQILDDIYFEPYRTLITETRAVVSIKYTAPISTYLINIQPSHERDIMKQIIESDYFPKQSNLSPRIIFHAIDIFDQYILWRIDNKIQRPEDVVTRIRIYTCLYLMYKYFTIDVMRDNIAYVLKIDFKSSQIEEIVKFENLLINTILKRKLYRHTLYETCYCEGDDLKTKTLFHMYFDIDKIRGVEVAM